MFSSPLIYHAEGSFFSQRARLGFEEKGIPYRKKLVNIQLGEQTEPWYIRLNPHGEVPIIEHNKRLIIDSEAILNYLDQITPEAPRFTPDPSTDEGAKVKHFKTLLKSVAIELITFGSFLHPEIGSNKRFMTPDQVHVKFESSVKRAEKYAAENPDLRGIYEGKIAKIKSMVKRMYSLEECMKAVEQCNAVLAVVEEELSKLNDQGSSDSWLCSKNFTIADIYLSTLLHRISFLGLGQRFFSNGKRPHLETYYQRVQKRRSFHRACGHTASRFWIGIYPAFVYRFKHSAKSIFGLGVLGLAIYAAFKYSDKFKTLKF